LAGHKGNRREAGIGKQADADIEVSWNSLTPKHDRRRHPSRRTRFHDRDRGRRRRQFL